MSLPSVFLIEEIERGETDVGHFLFAKNEALIGRDVVRLREISSGYRVRGCAARPAKVPVRLYRVPLRRRLWLCARASKLASPLAWSHPSLL